MPTFCDPIMVDFPPIPRGYSQSKKELFSALRILSAPFLTRAKKKNTVG
jgi:hypothetical protein